MSESLLDARSLRGEVEAFIHCSPWEYDVPSVPETPIAEWGTLAWARLVLALLKEGFCDMCGKPLCRCVGGEL